MPWKTQRKYVVLDGRWRTDTRPSPPLTAVVTEVQEPATLRCSTAGPRHHGAVPVDDPAHDRPLRALPGRGHPGDALDQHLGGRGGVVRVGTRLRPRSGTTKDRSAAPARPPSRRCRSTVPQRPWSRSRRPRRCRSTDVPGTATPDNASVRTAATTGCRSPVTVGRLHSTRRTLLLRLARRGDHRDRDRLRHDLLPVALGEGEAERRAGPGRPDGTGRDRRG